MAKPSEPVNVSDGPIKVTDFAIVSQAKYVNSRSR